jgi:hypothetical protein
LSGFHAARASEIETFCPESMRFEGPGSEPSRLRCKNSPLPSDWGAFERLVSAPIRLQPDLKNLSDRAYGAAARGKRLAFPKTLKRVGVGE